METNSSRLRQTRGAMRCCERASVYRALLVMLACGSATPAAAQVNFAQLRAWGLETYNEIDRTLLVPGTHLYAETASLAGTQSGGSNGRAYVWPASTQLRVLNTLTQLRPATYAPTLRLFADELQTGYWDNGF